MIRTELEISNAIHLSAFGPRQLEQAGAVCSERAEFIYDVIPSLGAIVILSITMD